MADATQYYFQTTMHQDVCPDCGDYGDIIAICDFNTGRVIKEKCEVCFGRWQLEWAGGGS